MNGLPSHFATFIIIFAFHRCQHRMWKYLIWIILYERHLGLILSIACLPSCHICRFFSLSNILKTLIKLTNEVPILSISHLRDFKHLVKEILTSKEIPLRSNVVAAYCKRRKLSLKSCGERGFEIIFEEGMVFG